MMTELLSHPLVVSAGLALLHFIWQGTALALALALVLSGARRSAASTRYLLACVTLVLMVSCPVYTFFHQLQMLPSEKLQAELVLESNSGPATNTSQSSMFAKSPAEEARSEYRANGAHTADAAWGPIRFDEVKRVAASWLCLCWLAGVCLLSIRFGCSFVGAVHLKRHGTNCDDSDLRARVAELSKRMRVSRSVRLLESAAIQVPIVIGWFKPAIVIPIAFVARLTPPQVNAMLAHELAHVKRYDDVVNAFQCAIETLLFYHPAIWWVSRRIRIEREFCCDDWGARLCGTGEYAGALYQMESVRSGHTAMALSMGGTSLKSRIVRLLQPPAPELRGANLGGLAGLVCAILLGVLGQSFLASADDIRVLPFPEDYSMGQLYIRDKDPEGIFIVTADGEGEKWRSFGPAQGTVEIPDTTEIFLRVISGGEQVDLSPLELLPPDGIQKFDASQCNLTDDDLAHISHLTGIRSLNLDKNEELTDAGLDYLLELTNVVKLGIEETSITGSQSQYFVSLSGLRFFDAYETPISDAGAAQLAGLLELEVVGLEKTAITGAALDAFRDLSKLEFLNLEITHITDADLPKLSHLTTLRWMTLGKTPITDEGLRALVRLENLETLQLHKTGITDAGLEILKQLPSLVEITTGRTVVTDAAVEDFRKHVAARRKTDAVASVTQQHSTNPDAPKVGVVLSHFTATGPHWMPDPYGYDEQANKMLFVLSDANFDLYAVIEPGTETDVKLAKILADSGLSEKLIDVSSAEELKTLDVVFSRHWPNVIDPALTALDTAMKSGVGFVCFRGFGTVTPGYADPRVQEILGTTTPEYIWGIREKCKVVTAHPILGKLEVGDTITPDMINGILTGPIENGTVLVGGPEQSRPEFPLIYIRESGNLRFVKLQWLKVHLIDHGKMAPYEIYVRAINWAAKRPADSEW